MEKFLFCVKCESPLTKIKPIAGDMLAVQKFLVNYPELARLKLKDATLLFNQWECECGNSIITIGHEYFLLKLLISFLFIY